MTAAPQVLEARLAQTALSLPMTFEQNAGQYNQLVRYAARGPGYGVFLTGDAIVVGLQTREGTASNDPMDNTRVNTTALRMRWVGNTRPAQVTSAGATAERTNYLIGKDSRAWHRDVGSFQHVRYAGIYDGVDLDVYGKDRELEYDFIVQPGKDPGAIGISMDGAQGVSIDTATGELVVKTAHGALRQHKPVVYQTADNGTRTPVEGAFALAGDGTVHFQLGAYDRTRAVVIDPVLTYGSYLGGSGADYALGVTVDGSNNIYVAGYTVSSNFPVTAAYDGTYGGAGLSGLGDAFVSKYAPGFTSATYTTYVGGAGDDAFTRVAVDSAGRPHMSGLTNSSDYPMQGAFDSSFNAGSYDATVTILDASGSSLAYASYFGGSGDDRGQAIALDGTGNVYMVGGTLSDGFPTQSAHQSARGGGLDAFALKLTPLGGGLTFSTYLGGSGTERFYGVVVDTSGNIFAAGNTNSTNFPTLGASQSAYGGGGTDAVAAKFGSTGTLLKSTFLGGVGDDSANAITLASTGDAWVVGSTNSTNFPSLTPYQASLRGGTDGFVTRLGGPLLDRKYSTFLGGSGSDVARDVRVMTSGAVVVVGETASTNFPLLDAVQSSAGGSSDGFVTQIAASGDSLSFSTYLGGSGADVLNALAIDTNNNIYTAGWTLSSNMTTSSPLQGANGGSFDALIARYGVTTSISLTTDKSSYTEAESVQLTYSGMAGNQYDWIAVALVGSPPTTYQQFFFSGAATSGTRTFTPLPGGRYEIRAFFNNTYTVQARSAPFTVESTYTVNVSTNKTSYAPGESVSVNFANMAGNQLDWIAIAPANAPASSYVTYQYTSSATSGTKVFNNLPNGTYVARAFFNNTYVIRGESAQFTIANAAVTLTTDASTYASPAAVAVTYAGMPAGNQYDWIAIAVAGSPVSSYVAYKYTGGSASGVLNFTLTTPGSYVVRAFPNWLQGGQQYVLGGESTPFTVTATPPTLTPDKSTYTTSESVVITYSGMPGNTYDWIALAVEGSSPDAPEGAVVWAYTMGATSGTTTLGPLPAGTYRVRAFYSNTGFTVQGQSASTITVQ